MRAIILPLTDVLFNFEKYNGSFHDRMRIKYPAYYKFIDSKIGNRIGMIFFIMPIAVLSFSLFFGPLYFIFILRYGYSKAKIKMHKLMDKLDEESNNKERWLFKTVDVIFMRYRMEETAVFVYYTSAMVPKKKKKQRKFLDKLKSIQKEFKIDHIQQANTSEDIETMIWLFDIDRAELFLATMEISTPQLFIPLKPIPGMYTEIKMKDDDSDYPFIQEDTLDENLPVQLNYFGRGCVRTDSMIEPMDQNELDGEETAVEFEFYTWLYENGYLKAKNQ